MKIRKDCGKCTVPHNFFPCWSVCKCGWLLLLLPVSSFQCAFPFSIYLYLITTIRLQYNNLTLFLCIHGSQQFSITLDIATTPFDCRRTCINIFSWYSSLMYVLLFSSLMLLWVGSGLRWITKRNETYARWLVLFTEMLNSVAWLDLVQKLGCNVGRSLRNFYDKCGYYYNSVDFVKWRENANCSLRCVTIFTKLSTSLDSKRVLLIEVMWV